MNDDEIRRVALLPGSGAYLHAHLVRGSDHGEYIPENSIFSILRIIPELYVVEGTTDTLTGQLAILESKQYLGAAIDVEALLLDALQAPR